MSAAAFGASESTAGRPSGHHLDISLEFLGEGHCVDTLLHLVRDREFAGVRHGVRTPEFGVRRQKP